jgi:hypothetical protein
MRHLKALPAVLLTAGALLIAAAPAQAAQELPEGCTKFHGTITCVTFDGPGNNQGGVGVTAIDETQGNTTNVSPEPQDLESSESCRPPQSQGEPCFP